MALQQPETKRPIARPRGNFGDLNVPGTRAGAIVSIGLVVLSWVAIPIARPFILGTAGVGLVVGLILFWAHRKTVDPEDDSLVGHPRK
jgi:hypothetical protein